MNVQHDIPVNGLPYTNGHVSGSIEYVAGHVRNINGNGNSNGADVHSNGRFISGHSNGTNSHTHEVDSSDESFISSPHPIVICGLAMRLPNGIRDADAFWDLLVSGKDARGSIPSDRYNPKGFDDKLGGKGLSKPNTAIFWTKISQLLIPHFSR